MWIKIDDGIATHRKYLKAGPLALALQVRAICFCSQNQTDGVIVPEAVQLLLVGLPVDVNWIQLMVENGLWDFNGTEYIVHGYLEWNLSRNDIEEHREKKRTAGRKGGKSRWNKEKKCIANAIAPAIAPASDLLIAEPWHAISISTSTSTLKSSDLNSKKEKNASQVKKPSRPALTDMEWLESLKIDPIYSGIDIDVNYRKASAWYPAHNRKLTRRAFVRWLINEIGNKPVGLPTENSSKCQSRVKRGNFYEPCGEMAVAQCAGKPMCQSHKEQYAVR